MDSSISADRFQSPTPGLDWISQNIGDLGKEQNILKYKKSVFQKGSNLKKKNYQLNQIIKLNFGTH